MILKKVVVTLMILSLTQLNAQKTKEKSWSEIDIEKKVLENSYKYNDIQSVTNSLLRIISLEGAKSTYRDSLAIIYFKNSNFVSSYIISKELLDEKPNNLQTLEINASSLKNIGAAKESIAVYEKLFGLSKNKYHGYELASLQFGLKRVTEAKSTIDFVTKCEDIKDFNIQIQVDKEKYQNVPLNAAVLNLKGLINYELKDNVEALKNFKEALVIMPEFELAKQNNNVLELNNNPDKK